MVDIRIHIQTALGAPEVENRLPPAPAVHCGDSVAAEVSATFDGAQPRRWNVLVKFESQNPENPRTNVIHEFEREPCDAFTFRFHVPREGPVTYHGEYIDFRWSITARLETSEGVVEKYQEFVVMPSEERRKEPAVENSSHKIDLRADPVRATDWLVAAMFGVLPWVVFPALILYSFISDHNVPTLNTLVVWVGTFLISASYLFYLLHQDRVSKNLVLQVIGIPKSLRLGQNLQGNLILKVAQPMKLSRVALRIRCDEHITPIPPKLSEQAATFAVELALTVATNTKWGGGRSNYKRYRPYEVNVVDLEYKLGENLLLPAGSAKPIPFSIEIPKAAMQSYKDSTFTIQWRLTVLCRVGLWPSIKFNCPFEVRPKFDG